MTVYSKGVQTTSTDAGATAFELTSTEEEKKKALRLEVWQMIAHGAYLTVWLEREKIVDAVPIEEFNDIAPPLVIPLDVEIPVGETLKAELVTETSGSDGVMWGALYYNIE